jgi:hypothetical protein
VGKWQRALEAADIEFIDESLEHGQAWTGKGRGHGGKMELLSIIACLATLCWAVWFFFIAD